MVADWLEQVCYGSRLEQVGHGSRLVRASGHGSRLVRASGSRQQSG